MGARVQDKKKGEARGAAREVKSEARPAPKDEGAVSVRPLGDRILVKRVESETKTKGGIYIPDSAKEKPQEALVVAVGPGKIFENGKRRELLVKKGDRVLFGKYNGTEVKLGGEEHLILSESDILGILD